jgi:predicted transcriptional regulator
VTTGAEEYTTTVVDIKEPTVPEPELPTVVRSAPSIWVTEDGELVPGSRVKRIRLAQDVLNSAEESVYDTLWSVKGAERDEGDGRIAQAGYDYLMKRTRLSKKTIQRIIDRLIEKDFIAIERPADIYTRTSTVYRVFGYRAVLDRQARRGRLHVVKIGPGFLYAHPLNMSTVASSDRPTDARLHPATGVASGPVTEAHANPPTVVPEATKYREQKYRESTPSASETAALRKLLEKHLGIVDDGAAAQLLADCRARAADCTLEEIAYFAGLKLQFVRNLQNPVGFVLTAVPKHFENGGYLTARDLLRREAEDRRRRWQETYDYWAQIAADPGRPDDERAEARQVLEGLQP